MSLADPTPTDSIAERLEAARAALRAYVARIGVPPHDRDDVVQEAMARAWRSRESFDQVRAVEPWLKTTALRVWIDQRRAQARQPKGSSEIEVEIPARVRLVEGQLDLDHLLARLSPIEQTLLMAFHRDGRTVQELADAHEMNVNTIKSHLRRARQRLAALEDR